MAETYMFPSSFKSIFRSLLGIETKIYRDTTLGLIRPENAPCCHVAGVPAMSPVSQGGTQ